MSKYSRELKITIANKYLAGETSNELSVQDAIPSRQLRYWSQVVAIHGNDAFLPTPHFHCAKEKFQALTLMWTKGWSLGHTSAVLNLVTPGTLSIWLDRYNKKGFNGLESGPRGRPTMKSCHATPTRSDDKMTIEELKEELAYLRAENAVLKKFEELEQQKRRQAKKKR